MTEFRFHVPRHWGEKIILVLLFFLFTLFFSNDFGLIDIQKTAIILAAGIDRTEEGAFSVTAQIAVPQASKSGSAAQSAAVNGTGETLAQAFNEISIKTGWFPKLIFCDLIVLGESVTDGNVFDCLGYFLRNEQMSDNCLLAACEGSAEAVLNAAAPTENMIALALQKILATEAKASGNVSAVNLKDFAADYYAEHKSGYMPYVRLTAEEGGESGGGTEGGSRAAAAAQDGGKNAGGKSGGQTFDASRTAVFYDGRQAGILDKEETFALNLAVGSVRQATLEVPFGDAAYALSLTDVSSKIDLDVDNNIPRLSVRLKAVARMSDAAAPEPIGKIAATNTIPPEVLRQAERILENDLSSLFEKCRAAHCDIFGAVDRLRKYEIRFHAAYKDVLLDRAVPSFSAEIKDSD